MAGGNNMPLQRMSQGAPRSLVEASEANALIDLVNKLQNCEVTVSTRTRSGFTVSGTTATLNINPRDINLGNVSGSAGSNAALESLLAALGGTFTVDDDTT